MKKHTHECLKNWINSEKTPKRIAITTYEPNPTNETICNG